MESEEIEEIKRSGKYADFYFNDKINRSKENQTLRELLVGFFDFYRKFDYSKNVVSIYLGKIISREDFASHPDLDSYRAAVNELKLPPIKLDNPKSFVIQDWKERIKLGQEERGEEVHNDNLFNCWGSERESSMKIHA